MKDIKDFIKIADVFGKEHAKKTNQVNENFVDNFLNFLGLRDEDDQETTDIVTDLSKKLTKKQKDAIAGRLDKPADTQTQGTTVTGKPDVPVGELPAGQGSDTSAADNQAQSDDAQDQGNAEYQDDAQATDTSATDNQAQSDAEQDQGNASYQDDAQATDTSATDNQAQSDDAQAQGDANYADDAQATDPNASNTDDAYANDAQATDTKSGASQAPTLKQKIDRFNELLRKAQESDEAGVPNAERDAQERGVQVASVDFRHLISLVEGVLNEALTAEEEKELQALFRELQGQVGVEPDLDKSIEDALNNYIKVKGDPKLQNQRGFDPNASNTDDAYANDAQATDPKLQNKRGFDPNKKEGPTLDSLAGQIKQGITFTQFEKIVKDAEGLEPEDAEKDANLLKKLGTKAKQLLSTADYRTRYVIAKGAENLQIDGLYRPDGKSFVFMQNGEPSGARGASLNGAMQVAQVGLLPPKKLADFKKLAQKNPKFQPLIAAHEKATGTVGNDAEEKVMAQDITPSVEKRLNATGGIDNFNISSARSMPYVDTIEDGKRTRIYGDKAALEKKFPGKKIGGITPTAQPKAQPKAQPTAQANNVQMASKEYDMTKKLDEASMNISMNGASSAEVAELIAILKNAGMPDAAPMAHMHTPEPEGPMPGDSPCGMGEEAVDEDWDNSPEETYADHHTMINDLSGGLNRQKDRKAIRVKDPAVESSIKEQLWAALNEKMTEGSRGKKKKSRGTMEGSRGKVSRGKKSRG